jgi:hypothetical protein
MFGRQKPAAKTFLLLDIESGSVGGALVRISGEEKPKLFGETRALLPVGMSLSAKHLASQVEQALKEVVRHLSEVAGRLRNATHTEARPIGAVGATVALMAAPWGVPDLQAGKPRFMQEIAEMVDKAVEARLGRLPLSTYTTAGAAAWGQTALLDLEPTLLLLLGGEVSELMHLQGGVVAHATMPVGEHFLLRTLRSHAGFSEPEARSAARLPFATSSLRAPFDAAGEHLSQQFALAARSLNQNLPTRVRVVGEEHAAEWFARALSASNAVDELFPNGGQIRRLAVPQLTAHIAVHQEAPDVRLMLGSLFVDNSQH